MKRTMIYWKTKDRKRKTEVKTELGITSVSVNGESEYKGDASKLEPYIEEGLIVIRRKDEQEVRRKKVYINTIESKPNHGEEIGCGGRKRKVR